VALSALHAQQTYLIIYFLITYLYNAQNTLQHTVTSQLDNKVQVLTVMLQRQTDREGKWDGLAPQLHGQINIFFATNRNY